MDWAGRTEDQGNAGETADSFFHPSGPSKFGYLIQRKGLTLLQKLASGADRTPFHPVNPGLNRNPAAVSSRLRSTPPADFRKSEEAESGASASDGRGAGGACRDHRGSGRRSEAMGGGPCGALHDAAALRLLARTLVPSRRRSRDIPRPLGRLCHLLRL